MDRFGSSGMGRMNGKEIFYEVLSTPKQAWNHFHVLRGISNGFISCIVRDGPWNWWCF